MCGFVGLVGRGATEPRYVVEKMRDQLVHRGPDGDGFWQANFGSSSVSFGFRRLAIVDLREEANQPMVSGDGKFVIVFNGEIYNFVELRAELERAGRVFGTRGDTEVLLQGYQEWGEDVVDRLNGMFAFMILNKERSEVFVARDRFGEKPLYMTELAEGKYAFASEMKAILAHPKVNASYDLEKFGEVLSGHVLFGTEKTLFKHIRQFPSAHCMTVSLQGDVIRKRRYWAPEYSPNLTGKTSEELQHELRELLANSLKLRMRTDVPVTACLSGGLDSSSLVANLASFSTNQGNIDSAISVRFPDDPTIDEGRFIDQVLQRTNLHGVTVTPTAAGCARDLRSLHWHHETIIPGPSMYLEWALMRQARSAGYKVILDGQGADEIFAGYSCYLKAYQAELGARGYTGLLKALMLGRKRDLRLQRIAKQYPDAERRFAPNESLALSDYKKYWNEIPAQRVAEYGTDGLPSIDQVGALRFELALNLLRTSLPSNVYSGDRNSMAHGIESRYPFLDYRLVDFALQLPDSELIDDGWSKSILRKAMAAKLPPEVIWRVDKVGFAAPQDKWIQTSELKSWVEERVFDNSLEQVDGYSKYRVAKAWKALNEGDGSSASLLWQWASAAELLDMKNEWAGSTTSTASMEVTLEEPVKKSVESKLEIIGCGGLFRAGRGGSGKTAWIVSYTPVSKEPRVLRQAQALIESGWRVVVFGLDGINPPPDEWNFVSIENAAPPFGGRKLWLFVRALKLASYTGILGAKFGALKLFKRLSACLVQKTTYNYYWRRKVIQAFADEKPDYRPDLVLGHDYFTADITLEMGKRFNVPTSIDCHEYALGQYAHDPKWVKWQQPVVRSFQDYVYSRIDGLTVVCEGIANLLANEHNLKREPCVVRSVPFYSPQQFRPTGEIITVLYHGEIFPTRALHVAVRSLRYWRKEYRLLLRGYADPAYVEELKKIAEESSVGHRLIIEAPVSFDQIVPAANHADIGYFVHLDTSPQRRFSLPNKFFEYVMAGLGLVVSDLPEMARLVNQYGLGELVEECEEQQIAAVINSLTREKIDAMKQQSLIAAKELNWAAEQDKLLALYQEIA